MVKEKTEELIKIFVTNIKTAEKKSRLCVVECSVLDVCFSFDVGRSMFDVGRSSLEKARMASIPLCKRGKQSGFL
jgi:3-dehydroquinate synthase class II